MGIALYYLDENMDTCRRGAFLLRLSGYRVTAFSDREEFQNRIVTAEKGNETADLLVVNSLRAGTLPEPFIAFLKEVNMRIPVVLVRRNENHEYSTCYQDQLADDANFIICAADKLRTVLSKTVNTNSSKNLA